MEQENDQMTQTFKISFILVSMFRQRNYFKSIFCNNYSFSFNPFHLYSFILHNFHIIDLFFQRKVDSFASTPHAKGINLEEMVFTWSHEPKYKVFVGCNPRL